MRLIDADKLCEEFKSRQNAALNWKEQAIMNDDLEIEIRADAVLGFLSEVKLTIDNAPTVELQKFLTPQVKVIGGRHNGKLKEQLILTYQKGWNDCIDAIIDNLGCGGSISDDRYKEEAATDEEEA